MPKEVINCSVTEDFRVKVGWDRESGHVQVATVAPKMPLVTEDTYEENNGWHVTMSRYSINQLIRTLRKARDQAFGADA